MASNKAIDPADYIISEPHYPKGNMVKCGICKELADERDTVWAYQNTIFGKIRKRIHQDHIREYDHSSQWQAIPHTVYEIKPLRNGYSDYE